MTGYRNVIILIFLLLGIYSHAYATDLNVGSGQTYTTIQGAVNVAVAGDTILIHAGTYTDSITVGNCGVGNYIAPDSAKLTAFCLKSSGTSGNPITMRNYSSDTVIIDGESTRDYNGYGVSKQYWTFDGIIFRNAKTTSLYYIGSSSPLALIVQNSSFEGTVTNPNDHAIEVKGNNALIDNNAFSGNGYFVFIDVLDSQSSTISRNTITQGASSYGIYLHSGTTGSLIERNTLIGGAGALTGIFFRDSNNITIRNNVIRGAYTSASILYQDEGHVTSGCLIYNNSILCASTAIGIKEMDTWATTTNNIISGCPTGIYAIQDTSLPAGQPKTNDVYGSTYSYYDQADAVGINITTLGTNNIVADPLYISSTDLQIPTGSPAKNTGTTLTGFSNDMVGISRPQGVAWDIGAYEFVINNVTLGTGTPNVTVGSGSGNWTLQ